MAPVLSSVQFQADQAKSHFSNVKYILTEIYQTTGTQVVMVLYNTTELQLDKTANASALMNNFPMRPGFFMLWIGGEGKEYFTSMSTLKFTENANTDVSIRMSVDAERERLSKL